MVDTGSQFKVTAEFKKRRKLLQTINKTDYTVSIKQAPTLLPLLFHCNLDLQSETMLDRWKL